jgi:hypothetical protein
MAPIVALAEALKDLLNETGAFTPDLNAVRTFQLFYELPEATTAKVSVYPTSDQTTGPADRSRWKHELVIDVAIQRKLADDTNTEKDAQVQLADDICEYLKANRPSGAWKLSTETPPTVQPNLQNEILRQNKLFTSVVRLTFLQHR